MCTNCESTTPTPCVDCAAVLQTINYCDDGCVDIVSTDCIQYKGTAINLANSVTISPLEQLTSIIKKLSVVQSDVTIAADFNPQNRVLTIKKNGQTVTTATIPDGDDQYLDLNPTTKKLSIWKPGATPVKINEVDLSVVLADVSFAAQSDSLLIVPGGTNGHAPRIEIIPSTDTGNALIRGSDGRPYVPTADFGVNNVIIHDVQGLTWTRVVNNGVIEFTPVFDWQYIASQICPLCNPACGAPSDLTVS